MCKMYLNEETLCCNGSCTLFSCLAILHLDQVLSNSKVHSLIIDKLNTTVAMILCTYESFSFVSRLVVSTPGVSCFA